MQPLILNLDTKVNNYDNLDLMQGYDYTLQCNMFDNWVQMDLTNVNIQVQLRKADKTFIIQTENITVNKNEITIEIDRDFTREDGKAKIQIILEKSSKRFGSWVIDAKIKQSAINDNDGQSENKVTITEALNDKIVEAQETKKELDISINNGNVAKIRSDLDGVINVDIPKINSSLETKANKSEVASPTQEQVNLWFDNNPQATTTVLDNSISYNKLDTVLKDSVIKNYDDLTLNKINDYYVSINGGTIDANDGFMYSEINVVQGEEYIVENHTMGNVAHYLIKDKDNTVISKFPTEFYAGERDLKTTVTIPLGGIKLFVSGTKTGVFNVEKLKNIEFKYSEGKELLEKQKDLFIRTYDSKSMDYLPFEKTQFVLTMDDGGEQLPNVYNVCKEVGVPLSVSIPVDRLSQVWNGLTVKDYCKKIVQDGGEILGHSFKVITASSTESDYIDVFENEKKVMAENGINIRGKILSGGADYLSNHPITDRWVKLNYDYSDLYGLNTSKMYYKERWWFHDWATIDNVKTMIDNLANEKTLVIMAMHGTNDTNDLEHHTHLKTILEYIKSKNNCEITTWAKVFDKYAYAKFK